MIENDESNHLINILTAMAVLRLMPREKKYFL
jgi:hypothetical protein